MASCSDPSAYNTADGNLAVPPAMPSTQPTIVGALRTMLDTSRDGIVIVDMEGHYLDANKAMLDMLGYTLEELRTKTFSDLTPPRWREWERVHMWENPEVMARGFSGVYEKEYIRKDGCIFPIEVQFSILFDSAGKPCQVWGIIRDISERKRSEAVLRESEQRFRDIFERSPDPAMLLDGDTYVDCNNALLKALGYETKEQFIGLHPWDIAPPLQPDGTPSREKAAREIAEAVRLGTHRFEWVHCDVRGRPFLSEVTLSTVVLRGVNLYYDCWRDITEYKRTENALRFTQFTVDHAADSVFWVRRDGGFFYANDTACRTLGYTREELLRLTVSDIDPDFSAERFDASWEAWDAQKVTKLLSSHRAKDGRVFPVEIVASSFEYEGETVLAVTARDISERVRAEAVLRESEQRFRDIFERSPDPAMLLEGDTFIDCNQALLKCLGFESKEQFIGLHPWDISPPLQPDGTTSQERAARELAEAARLGTHRFEWIHCDVRGRCFIAEVTLSTVVVRGVGLCYVTWRDVTENKRMENALRFTQFTVDHAADAIYWIHRDGRISYANEAACASLGYTREELLKLSVPDVDAEYSAERFAAGWNTWRTQAITTILSSQRTKDGRVFPVEIVLNYFECEGEGVLVSAVRDISERVRAEEEIRNLNAKLENRISMLTRPLADVVELRFEELLDVQEIQRIQDAFAATMGVASMITNVDGVPVTRPSNFCRLCERIIRPNEKGRANCCRSDALLGCECVGPWEVRPCLSAGLIDGVIRIVVGDRHIANWLVGQVLTEDVDMERIAAYAKEIGADEEQFRSALAEVTRMPRSQFDAVCKALSLLAGLLSRLAFQNVQQARFITEKRRVENALQFTQFTVDHAADSVFWIRRNGRFFYANEAACQLLGYRREEILALSVADIDVEFPRERFAACWDDWRRQKTTKLQSNFRTKQGSVLPVDIVASYFEYEGEEVLAVVARDVTEREEARRERERLVEKLRRHALCLEQLHRIDTAILADKDLYTLAQEVLDHLRVLIPCDRASFASADMRRGVWAVVGLYANYQPLVAVGDVGDLARTPAGYDLLCGRPYVVADLNETAEPVEVERRFIAEGLRSYISMPLHTGSVLYGVVTFASRTPRAFTDEHIASLAQAAGPLAIFLERAQFRFERERLLNELSQKSTELERLVYVASHDLRSPLVNIQGFGQRLEKACAGVAERIRELDASGTIRQAIAAILDEQIPNALGYIRTNVEKMDQLISGLLRFSRTERVALRLEKLDMNALIATILNLLRFQLQAGDVSVSVEPLPPCRGDAGLLTQAFSCLLDNAVKYRDPNRPLTITITGSVAQARAIYVVADTGQGIASDHQPKIWELFHRLSPRGPIAGEGVGLPLARRIIERHDGRIWVTSEVGQGSRFYVELPFGVAETSLVAAPPRE